MNGRTAINITQAAWAKFCAAYPKRVCKLVKSRTLMEVMAA